MKPSPLQRVCFTHLRIAEIPLARGNLKGATKEIVTLAGLKSLK